MVVREEQERVRTLLSDTITLLCRNGLSFKNEFNISAVIGITLDKDDVFLVDIRETIKNASGDASDSEDSEKPPKKSRKRRKRSHSTDDHANSDSENEMMDERRKTEAVQERLEVKTEVVNESDDEDLVFIKNEPGIFSPNVAVSDAYSLQGNQAANNSTLQSQGSQPYQDSGGQWNNPVLPPTFDPSTLGSNPSLQQPPLQQGQSPVNLDASIAQDSASADLCPECGKPFRSRVALKRHLDVHRGIFRHCCLLCGHGFTYKHALQAHMISSHQQDAMRIACPLCSHTFTRRDNMKVHMKTVHGQMDT